MSIQPKPLGYYVLIKVKPVEEITESGIITCTAATKSKQEHARDVGEIVSFGPLAFKESFSDCDGPEGWGVKVGDMVDFIAYEGRFTEDKKHIYIIDKQIMGLANE